MLSIYLQLINSAEEKSQFEELYYQYRKLMYYIAFDIVKNLSLAEDVVSETFLNIAKNFDFIQTLGNMSSTPIKRYVVVSVKHTAFNMVNREKRKEVISYEDVGIEFKDDKSNTLDIIIEEESIEKMKETIELLPEIYRVVMQLYIICEYNVEEVAKSLNIPKGTVYKRIQRARKIIEKALKEE